MTYSSEPTSNNDYIPIYKFKINLIYSSFADSHVLFFTELNATAPSTGDGISLTSASGPSATAVRSVGVAAAALSSNLPSSSSSSVAVVSSSENEKDIGEDILYMRGASFTIHLDSPPAGNTSDANDSRLPAYDEDEETNEIPDEEQLLSLAKQVSCHFEK